MKNEKLKYTRFIFAIVICSFSATFAKSHNSNKGQIKNLESTNGVNVNSIQKQKFNHSNFIVDECLSESMSWVTDDAKVAELEVYVECGSRPPEITRITYNEY